MIRQPVGQTTRILLGVLAIVAMLAAYTLISQRQHRLNPKDTTIPTWRQLGQGISVASQCHAGLGAGAVGVGQGGDEGGSLMRLGRRVRSWIELQKSRWAVADSVATGSRLFLGLGFGVLGAVILGLLMGCFEKVESFFVPPLSLLAKVPPTAALAVFFVLVGTDTEMYVAMIAFGVLPTLAQALYLGVKEVPRELVYKAYTLGASHTEVVWNVILRQVLPKIIDAVRLQIGPAMVFLIAAEMVCGDVGFGYRIRLQSRLLNMNVVYPYLALLAGFGFGMDWTLRRLQRWLCPWCAGGC